MSAIQERRAGFGHAGSLPLFAQWPEGTSLGSAACLSHKVAAGKGEHIGAL